MKKALALLAMVALVAGVSPAFAKKKTVYVFVGTVSSIRADADGTGALQMDVLRGNNAGTKWAERRGWETEVAVTASTSFPSSWEGVGENLDDVREADGVRVRAVRGGDGLVARSVEVLLQEYYGTIEDFDSEVGTVSLSYDETNDVADAWIMRHEDTGAVDADLADDAVVFTDDDQDPEPGWIGAVLARPSADEDGLEAVFVEAWPSEDEGNVLPLGL